MFAILGGTLAKEWNGTESPLGVLLVWGKRADVNEQLGVFISVKV